MRNNLICEGCDVRRLLLLENAIVNYSGGIASLEKRVSFCIHHVKHSCPEVAEILSDISRYLLDIIEVGELRKNFFVYDDNDCKTC
jgi:hypothetical protein